MEVTNGDIWAATTPSGEGAPSPLQELLVERWPIKTAYWLTRLARSLGGPRADIVAVREKLIRDLGTQRENGRVAIQQGDPNWPEFVAAHNDLTSQTVEIGIEKIALPQWNGCSIKPTTLLILDSFLDMTEGPTGVPDLKIVQ